MTDFQAWLSPSVMRVMAWALLHFLWQGMVLAAVFASLDVDRTQRSHPLCAGGFRSDPDGRSPRRYILYAAEFWPHRSSSDRDLIKPGARGG